MFKNKKERTTHRADGDSHDKKEIEEMRRNMTEAGVYSTENINEICRLETEYAAKCEEIAEQCVDNMWA